MNLFRSIGVAGWAWRSVLPLSIRPAIWLPFLIIAAFQGLALLVLTNFHNPALLPVALPIVNLLGGGEATHYPFFFFALPTLYSRAGIAIAVFISSVAAGAATLLFARHFGVEPGTDGPWKTAIRRAPVLIAVGLLFSGILFGISMLPSLFPQEQVLGSRVLRWGSRLMTLGLFILVQSLAAYSTAWIVLRGHQIFPAVRDSIRVTIRTFLPTLIVFGVPALLIYPLSYLASRGDLFVTKLNPETVTMILGIRIGLELILTFFLVGAITRLFLWRMETAR